MSRRSIFRRPLKVESLEKREVLSSGGPTAEAQYMLQLINLARTNPPAAAQWIQSHDDANVQATLNYYNVNLPQVVSEISKLAGPPPVGWSDTLAASATKQSQDEISMGVQTRSGADGSTIGSRLSALGFPINGENSYAYAESVDHAMEAFLIDWNVSDQGHRRNIMQPTATPDQFFQGVGIGIVNTNSGTLGPKVITVDFGRQANGKALLLGVAYNDQNGNGAYDQGEGQGNVLVSVTNVATGQSYSTLTWDNGGGYEFSLDPGTYNVTASVGGQVVHSQQITMYNQNIEVDYNLSPPLAGRLGASPRRRPRPPSTSAAA